MLHIFLELSIEGYHIGQPRVSLLSEGNCMDAKASFQVVDLILDNHYSHPTQMLQEPVCHNA